VLHDDAVGEMDVLMRAETGGCVIRVLRAAVDCVRRIAVIKSPNAFLLDVNRAASLDPVRHRPSSLDAYRVIGVFMVR